MSSITLPLGLLLLLAAPANVLAQSSATGLHAEHPRVADAASADLQDAAAPAVAIVDRFGEALAAGDLSVVAGLLAPDVLILESGGAEHSRDEYLSHHAIGDAKFLKDANRVLARRLARRAGHLAWVASESELHAKHDGKPLALLSTETMVLRQMPDGWRIVHIHWSSRPKR